MFRGSLTKILVSTFLAISIFTAGMTVNVSPVLAAECTDGQEVLGSGCECSPPRGYPYHETNNRDSANPQRFCVDRCSPGDDTFNSSGVPNCFCASDAGLIIDVDGTCVSESPDCTTGSPVENCSCYLPRRSVTLTGSTTAYCVELCADGQRTTNTAGNPACSCDFRNYNGYCVRDCASNQLVNNDAGAPLCFCPGEISDNHCVEANGGDGLGPTDGISSSDFDAFNPLKVGPGLGGGEGSALAGDLSTPGGLMSRLLEFAFPIAGMILFVMLVWGGFEMVYGASNTSKAIEAGKNRITTAIIGFVLLFASYWIVQILEVIFKIKIF